MPAFQAPATSGAPKRKSETDHPSRKRLSIEGSSSYGLPEVNASENASNVRERYWMVQWRTPQHKKHKTWDGDAVLVENGIKGTMYDLEGKLLGVGKPEFPIREEKLFNMSGREFEVDHVIQPNEFKSGSCFGRTSLSTLPVPTAAGSSVLSKQFIPPQRNANITNSTNNVAGRSDRKATPLQPVRLTSIGDNLPAKLPDQTRSGGSHWTAYWRKPQHKKHKAWEGDAFVSHIGDKLTMISEEGKLMGSTTWKGELLYCGYQTCISGKEIELDREISASQVPATDGTTQDFEIQPEPSPPPTSFLLGASVAKATHTIKVLTNSKAVDPASFYGAPAKPKPGKPLHDPEADGAIVMKGASKEYMKKYNKKNLPPVPVVLDPILARRMRPHQTEGVKFLYECVMGLRKHEGKGCILADEMGLGKTLQTISLVWTLLKQNPCAGVGPVIGKALIVCPVTLVNNWKAEFHKWLGRDRVGVLAVDKDKVKIKTFVYSKVHQVLVIGYERLRTIIDELVYCDPPIGLIVCDEGHRLKSANNKTSAMFKTLRTNRRVILSGTPIQNDLGEFHATADFCNPGLLDDYATFRRVYETPILKSRAPDCSAKEIELGQARSAQLLAIAKSFVLRREANILKNYLPPKHEYVVFVTPTRLQLAIFAKILNPEKLENLMQSSTAESLALITLLTKISNSPILLKATADKAKSQGGESSSTINRIGVEEAVKLLPERAEIEDVSFSGKLTALASLLKAIRENTDEKCIIVSHYTSMLNVIEAYCNKKSYTYYRLDGQTPAAKRQEYVNLFNKSSQRSRFLFLLSSKAGGVGLSLIGASRLCLIDCDWNPSHDLQSMARIHRDGQKHPVFIYRFLTAGTIDEKIFQRQVTKLGLSESLMGSGTTESKSDSFSRKDLRDIFRIHPGVACNTHDLLECPCDGLCGNCDIETPVALDDDVIDVDAEKGFVVASQVQPAKAIKMDKADLKKKKVQLASLGEWTHINCLRPTARDNVKDDILRKLLYVREEAVEKPTVKKMSRLDSLLSAVDLENIAAFGEDVPSLNAQDFPGGTVSFLFERSSEVLGDMDGGEPSTRD